MNNKKNILKKLVNKRKGKVLPPINPMPPMNSAPPVMPPMPPGGPMMGGPAQQPMM